MSLEHLTHRSALRPPPRRCSAPKRPVGYGFTDLRIYPPPSPSSRAPRTRAPANQVTAGVCHDVRWASQCVASRLERMLSQPAHVLRLSKTVSTHAVSPHEFFVSSSTRLETMTCYLQTSYLETRKTVLPSVCLETTFLHFEIP